MVRVDAAETKQAQRPARVSVEAPALIGTHLDIVWEYQRDAAGDSGAGFGRAGVSVTGERGRERAEFWVIEPDGSRRSLITYERSASANVKRARFEIKHDAQGRLRSADVWCDGWVLRVSVQDHCAFNAHGLLNGFARSILPQLLGLRGGQYYLQGFAYSPAVD